MKLFIPPLKTIITLTQDWTFSLYAERRNLAFAETLNLAQKTSYLGEWKNPVTNNFERINYNTNFIYPIVIPQFTQLRIERIYIRSGNKDFDSVTFVIQNCPNSALSKKRFWAKLSDVNNIDYV